MVAVKGKIEMGGLPIRPALSLTAEDSVVGFIDDIAALDNVPQSSI